MKMIIGTSKNKIRLTYPVGTTMRDIRSNIKNAMIQHELVEFSSSLTNDKLTYFVNPNNIEYISVDEKVVEIKPLHVIKEAKTLQIGTFTGSTTK